MTLRSKKPAVAGPCDGCGKCIEACLQANSKTHGSGKSAIKLFRNGSGIVPVFCRNCEDAPCVTACMSGCRRRNGSGWVITDYRRCVGCWMCVMNCPFGAIEKDESSHVAFKCEGCLDEETQPCVAACVRGLLVRNDILAFSRDARKRAAARFLTGE